MHVTVGKTGLWVTDLKERDSLDQEASSGMSGQEIRGPKYLKYDLEIAA